MKSSDKLINRLVRDNWIKPNDSYEFERLYATWDERSYGAWAWQIHLHGHTVIGSKFAVYECLQAEKLEDKGGMDLEIGPVNYRLQKALSGAKH